MSPEEHLDDIFVFVKYFNKIKQEDIYGIAMHHNFCVVNAKKSDKYQV